MRGACRIPRETAGSPLGKGEVDSSILSSSTTFPRKTSATGVAAGRFALPRLVNHRRFSRFACRAPPCRCLPPDTRFPTAITVIRCAVFGAGAVPTPVLAPAPDGCGLRSPVIVRHDTPPSRTPSRGSRHGSFPLRGRFIAPGMHCLARWQHLGLTACRGMVKLEAEK